MIIAAYSKFKTDKEFVKRNNLYKYHLVSNGHEVILPVAIIVSKDTLGNKERGIFKI